MLTRKTSKERTSAVHSTAALSDGPHGGGEWDIASLLKALGTVKDPRKRRGRMYGLTFMLAASLIAVLAGASNFRQVADHVADLPQSVLRKPAALTVEERRLVRMHPAVGSALVERIPYLSAAARVVRDAHERVDGLGFPLGSRGDAVWIGARIVCVADAYDTRTRSRSYRDPVAHAEALAELERCAGTQFDTRVGRVFRTVADG